MGKTTYEWAKMRARDNAVTGERMERAERGATARREAAAKAAAETEQARFNALPEPQKFAEHVRGGVMTEGQAKLAAALEISASSFSK